MRRCTAAAILFFLIPLCTAADTNSGDATAPQDMPDPDVPIGDGQQDAAPESGQEGALPQQDADIDEDGLEIPAGLNSQTAPGTNLPDSPDLNSMDSSGMDGNSAPLTAPDFPTGPDANAGIPDINSGIPTDQNFGAAQDANSALGDAGNSNEGVVPSQDANSGDAGQIVADGNYGQSQPQTPVQQDTAQDGNAQGETQPDADSGISPDTNSHFTPDGLGEIIEGVNEIIEKVIDVVGEVVETVVNTVTGKDRDSGEVILVESTVNIGGTVAKCFGIKCSQLNPTDSRELVFDSDNGGDINANTQGPDANADIPDINSGIPTDQNFEIVQDANQNALQDENMHVPVDANLTIGQDADISQNMPADQNITIGDENSGFSPEGALDANAAIAAQDANSAQGAKPDANISGAADALAMTDENANAPPA